MLEAEVFSPESPLWQENTRLKEQVEKLQGQLRGLICDVHNSKTLDFADRDDMVSPQAGILAKYDDMLDDEGGHRHVLELVPAEQPGVSSAQGAPEPNRTHAAAARGPEGTGTRAPTTPPLPGRELRERSAARFQHFQDES